MLSLVTMISQVNVASTNSSCASKPTFDTNVTPPERSCDTVQAGGSFTAYILATPSEGRRYVTPLKGAKELVY